MTILDVRSRWSARPASNASTARPFDAGERT